jgi:hypothetical protein
MKRSGFTLVDLAAVVLVCAAFLTLTFVAVAQGRSSDKAAMCSTHLIAIGKALQLYNADNDVFPAVNGKGGDSSAKGGLGLGLPDTKQNVYDLAGTFPGDNFSLLVYKGLSTWDWFLCPATQTTLKDRLAKEDMFGFGAGKDERNAGKDFIDYGMHIPQHYLAADGKKEHKAYLSQNAEATMPIMTDKPPADVVGEWSPNHAADLGENVLMFGGTVRFVGGEKATQKAADGKVCKNMAGYGGNNIYALDMAADVQDGNGDCVAGKVAIGDKTPPGPTISKYDSVIYWASNAVAAATQPATASAPGKSKGE